MAWSFYPTPDGPRILVVHRPRYDDWTFPKGKDEAGEDSLEAALREVTEETGQHPHLVSMVGETNYPVDGTTKLVRWYGMRVAEPGSVRAQRARSTRFAGSTTGRGPGLLSYDHDRKLLERGRSRRGADHRAPVPGSPRCGRRPPKLDLATTASDPSRDKGNCRPPVWQKPLPTERIEAIFTSPYVRCVQTVRPLAEATGLEIVEHPALAEGEGGKATRDLVRSLVGTNAVLCSHGDVIPAALQWMINKGMTLKSDFDCKKGSTWEITVRGGVFHKAHYLPPLEA